MQSVERRLVCWKWRRRQAPENAGEPAKEAAR